MKPAYMGLAVLMSGLLVATATFIVGLAVAPYYTCPPCTGSRLCALMACVVDVRSHAAVAVLFGLVAGVLAFLALRRWDRSRT